MNKVGPWITLLDTVDIIMEHSLATLAIQQPHGGVGGWFNHFMNSLLFTKQLLYTTVFYSISASSFLLSYSNENFSKLLH